ncbi:MAG TPA: hypothetical protein VI978_01905 [Candidatus Paceibacterota bacterium]
MTNFYLSFLGSILTQIKSSRDLELSKILLGAYLPGAELVEKPDQMPDIVIEHEHSDISRFIQEEGRVHVYGNWEKEFPLDFYHLLYSVIRVELLKRDLFPVHAACIGKDDYTLIVGHTGVGKTSIVLEILKNKDLLLFSGNKTIVSFKGEGLEAIAGTKTLTARQKDIGRHLGYKIEIIQYGNRAGLVFGNKTDKSGPIRAIVLVNLNDGVTENNLIEPSSALHRLYPYFLDTINADTIIGQSVYVGTPPIGTQEKLAQNLKETLSKIPTYAVSGSMDFVCDSIIKI